MALKINDLKKDLPKLNQELSRLDQHNQRLTELEALVKKLLKQNPLT